MGNEQTVGSVKEGTLRLAITPDSKGNLRVHYERDELAQRSGLWCLRCAIYDRAGKLLKSGEDWTCRPTSDELQKWPGIVQGAMARWPSNWPMSRVYIRFGRLPRRTSINHATGQREAGVSCYDAEAHVLDCCYRLRGNAAPAAAIFSAFSFYDGVTLLLHGDEVGVGSDGEPLLDHRTVRVVGSMEWDSGLEGFVLSS